MQPTRWLVRSSVCLGKKLQGKKEMGRGGWGGMRSRKDGGALLADALPWDSRARWLSATECSSMLMKSGEDDSFVGERGDKSR